MTNEVYRKEIIAVLKEGMESDDPRVKELALQLIERALKPPQRLPPGKTATRALLGRLMRGNGLFAGARVM